MTTADTADFADRPWMDAEAEPIEPTPSRAAIYGWRAFAHAGPLLAWIMPVLGVGMLIPLVLWQTKAKQDGDLALADHAVESLNFQINIAVLSLLCTATIIGVLLLPILWIGGTVYSLIAAYRVYHGNDYRYPWIARPIKVD